MSAKSMVSSTTLSTTLLFLTILMLLPGCASLNKDECLNSDWKLIGYEDGANGQNMQRIGNHRKACAKHGVTPDIGAYKEGRLEGLGVFCEPSRAYRYGLGGSGYNGVCPKEIEAGFLTAFNQGRNIYLTRKQIKNNKDKIVSREQDLKNNKESVKAKEGALISAQTTEIQRVAILSEVKELSKEQQKIEKAIFDLTLETMQAEKELLRLERKTVDYQ